MMEKPTITLRWSRYGRDYHKEVDRSELFKKVKAVFKDPNDIFLGLFHSFENENEVSKKILKYLPDASELVYNIDTKELFFKDGKKYLDGFIIGEENNIVIGIFDKLAQ